MAVYFANVKTGRIERILDGPEVYETVLKRYGSKEMAQRKSDRRTKTIQQMDRAKKWRRLGDDKGRAALKRWTRHHVTSSPASVEYDSEQDNKQHAKERIAAEEQRLDRTQTPRRSEGGESTANVVDEIIGE